MKILVATDGSKPAMHAVKYAIKLLRSLSSTSSSITLISVHDDGPGFDPSILPTAFERFTIADRARTRRASTGGAGLGLAIVRSLAEMTGGSARAMRSNHLGGGLVEVTMPLTGEPGHRAASADRATELDNNAPQGHLV